MLTHHARFVDPDTGNLVGALTDLQARKAGELIRSTGVAFDLVSFPEAQHAMHTADPRQFADELARFASSLPPTVPPVVGDHSTKPREQ